MGMGDCICMAASPIPSVPIPSIYKPNKSALPLLISKSQRVNKDDGMRPIIIMFQMCRNCVEVKQLHAQLVVSGCLNNNNHPQFAGRLIQSYVSVSEIGYAESVLGNNNIGGPSPDLNAYNAMIRGLTLTTRLPTRTCPPPPPHQAQSQAQMDMSLLLFSKLLLGGLLPDPYTYTFVLKACSSLKALSEGKQIHGQMIKVGIGIAPGTRIPYSSLVHMYANSGDRVSAERVVSEFPEELIIILSNSMISGYFNQGCPNIAGALFSEMRERDVASWSVMITGYTKNGMYLKALHAFREMLLLSELLPNESTLVSALSACAHLGALHQGRRIHTYIHKLCGGIDQVSVSLGTALVNMYAKCGSISCGYQVFRTMSQKDVIAWGTIISGFAIHGQPEKCFQLFDEMLHNGIRPNAVIFVAILSACRHAGYVELGQDYFHRMIHEFGVCPSIEHYGCIVDLFGRAGRLRDAENVIISMPEEPNPTIWGAYLSACRTHRDLTRGRRALRHLIELDPKSGDRYKLAVHIFATAGKTPQVAKLRKIIKEYELHTTCGSSFIELDGIIHEFSTGNICTGKIEPKNQVGLGSFGS